MFYNPYLESAKILSKDDVTSSEVQTILEDANSPVTRKYNEKMYKAVLNKAHIDFGDIPKSNGNIRNYSGYASMVDTLQTIQSLAEDEKSKIVLEYVKVVQDAIHNIEALSSTYEKGFTTKTEYVGMEYDTYVYFCVEATTALIYSFVEIIKSPDKQMMDMKIKNTKLRADEFYFDQLKKFNRIQNAMGIDYRKMMEAMCDKGRENFVGMSTIVGAATIAAVATAIVPVTREVIYQLYNFRGKLSTNLEVQAHFLEMNRTRVENNDVMTADKKKKVLDKQEKLAKRMMKLSDEIRVKSAKSIMDAKKELEKDNKMLSINSIRDEVSNAPFEIL